jgi:transcriptional regulator with XRE-family HTH domain
MGIEIRGARLIHGSSIETVAAAIGISPSQVGRIERGVLPTVSVDQLARLGAAVGLDIRVRSYPGPDPTLDTGQIRLLNRLRSRLDADLTFRTEVPLPTLGDQRAWDALVGGLDGDDLPVDAETRLVDLQSQVRRVTLKLRDSGFDAVLLVVSDSRRNRQVLAGAGSILATDFPVTGRTALRELAAGRHPGGSSIVVL